MRMLGSRLGPMLLALAAFAFAPPVRAADGVAPSAPTGAAATSPADAVRKPVAFERHLDVGGGVGIFERLTDAPTSSDSIEYDPAIGYTVFVRWDLLRNLGFAAHYTEVKHDVNIPRGALGTRGGIVSSDGMQTYLVGARLQPMIPFRRARCWLSVGVAWGHAEFDEMIVAEPDVEPFRVRGRDDVLLDYELGVGGSYDVVPKWFVVSADLAYGLVDSRTADAFGTVQAVDSSGSKRQIAALPAVTGSFSGVVSLALSL